MAIKPVNDLKSYFETGDRPTQVQFEHLIDSLFHKQAGFIITAKSYNEAAEGNTLALTFSDGNTYTVVIPTGFTIAEIDGLVEALDGKVDKVAGKGLSTNDYTAGEKTKVANSVTHAATADIHITAAEKIKYSNKTMTWLNGEILPDNSGEILRHNGNVLYKFIGTFPFTTTDIAAELTAGHWEAVLQAPANLSELVDDIGAADFTTLKTVFVHLTGGDDNTAKIENASYPYQTLDAAIAAVPDEGIAVTWRIHLLTGGTYPINVLIPALKSLTFFSISNPKISFAASPITGDLYEDANTNGAYIRFEMPSGSIDLTTPNVCTIWGWRSEWVINVRTLIIGNNFKFEIPRSLDCNIDVLNLTGIFVYRMYSTIRSCTINIGEIVSAGSAQLFDIELGGAGVLYINIGNVSVAGTFILNERTVVGSKAVFTLGNITCGTGLSNIAVYSGANGAIDYFFKNSIITGNAVFGMKDATYHGNITMNGATNKQAFLWDSSFRDGTLTYNGTGLGILGGAANAQFHFYNYNFINNNAAGYLVNDAGGGATIDYNNANIFTVHGFASYKTATPGKFIMYSSITNVINIGVLINGEFTTNANVQNQKTPSMTVTKTLYSHKGTQLEVRDESDILKFTSNKILFQGFDFDAANFKVIAKMLSQMSSGVAIDLTSTITQADVIPSIVAENTLNANAAQSAQVVLSARLGTGNIVRLIATQVTSTSVKYEIVMRGVVVMQITSGGTISFFGSPAVAATSANVFSNYQQIVAIQAVALNLAATNQKTATAGLHIAHSGATGNRWAQLEISPSSYNGATRIIATSTSSSTNTTYIVLRGRTFITLSNAGTTDSISFNDVKLGGLANLDLSNLPSYADDAAAATGSLAVGMAYVNSSTGAVHRRLT